jgi:hypothetical protein
MKKTYIILLKNNYILPFAVKPVKKGNYLSDVRLFETDVKTSCADLAEWMKSKFKKAEFVEVLDWE